MLMGAISNASIRHGVGADDERCTMSLFLLEIEPAATTREGSQAVLDALRVAAGDTAPAELIESPRSAPMLSGYRTASPVNKNALIDLVLRVSTLADDLPEVRHLICDPVLASATGADTTDARIRIGPEPMQADFGPRRLR